MDNLNKDRKLIWPPFSPLKGGWDRIVIKRGEGVYLITEDERKIIDAISSWWVNIHGHAHPEIASAIAQQASDLEQVIFAGFTHPPAIKLAESLLNILPENQCKVFFSDDGSTSVEVAVKMALQYWYNLGLERTTVVALRGAYHGDTFGSMSVGDRGSWTLPFHSKLFDVNFIDFPSDDNLSHVLEQFESFLNKSDVAAFIYEPLVQGAAGMRMYSPRILQSLLEVASRYQVICIADEVMTGFGRTGKHFASLHTELQPDIFCLSKGLTGGTLPLGITTASRRLVEAFDNPDRDKAFYHGHSYTANPISCAAANASLKLLLGESCQQHIKRICQKHEAFKKTIENHPKLDSVRQTGTILALEIGSDLNTSYDHPIRDKIYHYFLKRDILLRPLGNIMYLLPPYVISNQELDQVYETIRKFLEEI